MHQYKVTKHNLDLINRTFKNQSELNESPVYALKLIIRKVPNFCASQPTPSGL